MLHCLSGTVSVAKLDHKTHSHIFQLIFEISPPQADPTVCYYDYYSCLVVQEFPRSYMCGGGGGRGTDRQTDRQREREGDRQKDRDRDRQTDRQTNKETDRDGERATTWPGRVAEEYQPGQFTASRAGSPRQADPPAYHKSTGVRLVTCHRPGQRLLSLCLVNGPVLAQNGSPLQ